MKKFLNEYLSFSRSEARISWIILFLLLGSIVFRMVVSNKSCSNPVVPDDILAYIVTVVNEIESAEAKRNKPELPVEIKYEKPPYKTPELVFFDPNTVDSIVLVRMGLNRSIVRNILKYREAGGRFHEKSDLLKIYGMNDSVYNILDYYIVMEKTFSIQERKQQEEHKEKDYIMKTFCINTIDSSSLARLRGIPPGIAGRILKFRYLLGGFNNTGQLMEVYGMDSVIYNKLLPLIYIDTSKIMKLNVNTIKEFDLSRHPYINPLIARNIVKYRKLTGNIRDLNELVSGGIITEEDLQKLYFYLTAD